MAQYSTLTAVTFH